MTNKANVILEKLAASVLPDYVTSLHPGISRKDRLSGLQNYYKDIATEAVPTRTTMMTAGAAVAAPVGALIGAASSPTYGMYARRRGTLGFGIGALLGGGVGAIAKIKRDADKEDAIKLLKSKKKNTLLKEELNHLLAREQFYAE